MSSSRFTDMAAKERYEGLRTASCCTRDVKSQEAKPTITSQELREQPPFFDFSKLKEGRERNTFDEIMKTTERFINEDYSEHGEKALINTWSSPDEVKRCLNTLKIAATRASKVKEWPWWKVNDHSLEDGLVYHVCMQTLEKWLKLKEDEAKETEQTVCDASAATHDSAHVQPGAASLSRKSAHAQDGGQDEV